ncbi:MAG: hypothetical protein LBG61_03820 [Burkholderiales bacterium]|jgi:hypothetical protein|nr:hypothetical protein [Burkholderiales bacterium]
MIKHKSSSFRGITIFLRSPFYTVTGLAKSAESTPPKAVDAQSASSLRAPTRNPVFPLLAGRTSLSPSQKRIRLCLSFLEINTGKKYHFLPNL